MIPVRALILSCLLAAGLAPAAAEETAVVAKYIIYPGETVDEASLVEVRLRSNNRIAGSIALFPDQIAGKVAKRTLLPGKLISMSSVREPYLVEAGAPVQMDFVEGGLLISATGVPLQPGAAGDMVKVRNSDSGKVISGIVMADGTIRIGR